MPTKRVAPMKHKAAFSERVDDLLYRTKDLAYSLPPSDTRTMLIAMLKEAIMKIKGRWPIGEKTFDADR